MATFTCPRCGKGAEEVVFRAYCADCIDRFYREKRQIMRKMRSSSEVFADGKFAEPQDCPRTSRGPRGNTVCGLCGSDNIDPGYGWTGYGMGSYNFCLSCDSFLDFQEDVS